MTNIADIVEGARFYSNESWALLLKRLVTETSLFPRREYTSPALSFLATLHIQNKTTSDAGIEKWGFPELLHRLNALPEWKVLRIEQFDAESFAVRFVFDGHGDGTLLLGCTIVKKKRKAMQTPPAWDGWLDALERFNNQPQE